MSTIFFSFFTIGIYVMLGVQIGTCEESFSMAEPGQRIRELRMSVGLNQSQFAEKIGIAQPTLSLMEKGKAPIPRYISMAIAYAFDSHVDWLQHGIGKMHPSAEPLGVPYYSSPHSSVPKIHIMLPELLGVKIEGLRAFKHSTLNYQHNFPEHMVFPLAEGDIVFIRELETPPAIRDVLAFTIGEEDSIYFGMIRKDNMLLAFHLAEKWVSPPYEGLYLLGRLDYAASFSRLSD